MGISNEVTRFTAPAATRSRRRASKTIASSKIHNIARIDKRRECQAKSLIPQICRSSNCPGFSGPPVLMVRTSATDTFVHNHVAETVLWPFSTRCRGALSQQKDARCHRSSRLVLHQTGRNVPCCRSRQRPRRRATPLLASTTSDRHQERPRALHGQHLYARCVLGDMPMRAARAALGARPAFRRAGVSTTAFPFYRTTADRGRSTARDSAAALS